MDQSKEVHFKYVYVYVYVYIYIYKQTNKKTSESQAGTILQSCSLTNGGFLNGGLLIRHPSRNAALGHLSGDS